MATDRRLLALLNSCALCLGLFVSPMSVMAQWDWSQFGGPRGGFEFDVPWSQAKVIPTKSWRRTLGVGMAGVVVRNGMAYTSFLAPWESNEQQKPEQERQHTEVIVALEAKTGQTRWKHAYEAGWRKDQQAFGGRSRAPQATPAICGDYLLSIGFTGIISCLDAETGKLVWKKDAVASYGAVPVQFGFSASPVPMGDRVVMLVGGDGGLLCLDAKTGSTVWNVPCKEASYATPVVWDRPDGRQIVFVTRNRVIGVDAEVGRMLWEYQLPGAGLTNVPTPMPIDGVGLVVSGQGVKGTRRLDIVTGETQLRVSEVWQSDEQFFYCNWVRRGDVLWGSDGKLLVAIELTTGKRVGRFRGFNDANVLTADRQMISLDGEGNLSTLQAVETGMEVTDRFRVLDQRCWTPPTVAGDSLYVRGGDQLVCLSYRKSNAEMPLRRIKIRKAILALADENATTSQAQSEPEPSPIDRILAAYESSGAEPAWRLYRELRKADPEALSFRSRQELARLAKQQGLADFAKQIARHMGEDFPDETQEQTRELSTKRWQGENGLVYIEFAIRNTSRATIHAIVKGPEKHPFGYGLPLRPNLRRVEKWPVGTKLYRTQLGVRRDVLLTVKEEFAGKTIELPVAK